MSPPSSVRATTISACPSNRIASGDTTSTASGIRSTLLQRLGLCEHRFGAAHVEERLLRYLVELTVHERLERLHRLRDRHVDALQPGEDLADEERLRKEPLHLAGTRHGDAVLFGKLVEAKDGDDVLQLLVALQHLLHPPGDLVVTGPDDLGSEDVRRRGERVDR